MRQLAEAITGTGFVAGLNDGLSPQFVERMKDVFKTGAVDRLRWTEDAGEIPTIEIIRAQRPPGFPTDAIKHKRNALCLFCARFYGRSDVIHVHDICPDHMTLVDYDAPSMEDMKLIYPVQWTYICTDYKEFLQQASQSGLSYDLIVCDEWPWIAKEVVWDSLPTIMKLCSDTFIADYFGAMLVEFGHRARRSGGIHPRAVTQRTGVDVVFTQMMSRGRDVYWAVMRKG